ncbi:MAG TPA: hypothetical protein VF597_02155 [Candidatus Saccharimonadales bacterium]
MNIFGFIVGPNILTFSATAVTALLSYQLLSWGWIAKIIGLVLFSGSVGFLMSQILHKGQADQNGVNLPILAIFIAALVAAIRIYEKRDDRRMRREDSSRELNGNTLIGLLLIAVIGVTALSYILQANVENYFNFDSAAADLVIDRSSSGVKRYGNILLIRIDRELAK